MNKMIIVVISLLLLAPAAFALVSQEDVVNTPESEEHQLQWRPTPLRAWEDVGAPQPLADVTHPSVTGSFRGVDWDLTGTVQDFGEWRAIAVRYDVDSDPSNVIDRGVPEPPAAPLMLAALGTLFVLRGTRRK